MTRLEISEINDRLNNGETLHCPSCHLGFNGGDDCAIICCDDPFQGPGKFEAARHAALMETYLDMQREPGDTS